MRYILNVNTAVSLTSIANRLVSRPLDSMSRPLCWHFVTSSSGRMKYVNPHSCHAPTRGFSEPFVYHQQLTQPNRRLKRICNVP